MKYATIEPPFPIKVPRICKYFAKQSSAILASAFISDLKRILIMSQYYQYDVLIIGSGAAGLTTALTLP
ncbi:MAG: hypothetical protein KBH26_00635, partial [Thiopseudomonas sp.]|nr:hypothetical protein [Thiopseudomonas sp.]